MCKLREDVGRISQERLGEYVGESAAEIARIEEGRSDPSLYLLVILHTMIKLRYEDVQKIVLEKLSVEEGQHLAQLIIEDRAARDILPADDPQQMFYAIDQIAERVLEQALVRVTTWLDERLKPES
jgi:transcriptional regulator with XRE-family HTH domain